MRTFTANSDMHLGTPDPELGRLELLDNIAFFEECLVSAEEAKDEDCVRWYQKAISNLKGGL